jgi:hypothetical protein
MQRDILFLGNSTGIRLRNLKNKFNQQFMNSATASVTLLDENGSPIAGETWPKAMPYVSNSDGTYEIGLSSSIDIQDGQQVTMIVTAVQGGIVYRQETPMLCLRRVSSDFR